MHHTYGDSLLTLAEHAIHNAILEGQFRPTPTIQQRDVLRHDLTKQLRQTINTFLQQKGAY